MQTWIASHFLSFPLQVRQNVKVSEHPLPVLWNLVLHATYTSPSGTEEMKRSHTKILHWFFWFSQLLLFFVKRKQKEPGVPGEPGVEFDINRFLCAFMISFLHLNLLHSTKSKSLEYFLHHRVWFCLFTRCVKYSSKSRNDSSAFLPQQSFPEVRSTQRRRGVWSEESKGRKDCQVTHTIQSSFVMIVLYTSCLFMSLSFRVLLLFLPWQSHSHLTSQASCPLVYLIKDWVSRLHIYFSLSLFYPGL